MLHLRVVGGASLAWVKAAEAWGCALEALALVLGSPNDANDIIMHLVSRITPTSATFVLTVPPKKDWGGLLVLTICSAVDAQLVVMMFDCS